MEYNDDWGTQASLQQEDDDDIYERTQYSGQRADDNDETWSRHYDDNGADDIDDVDIAIANKQESWQSDMVVANVTENITAVNPNISTNPLQANSSFAQSLAHSISQANDTESEKDEKATSIDDSASESRYRDSEELRYSLRSLELFAPWVRKVYIVTDNQIPRWLNLNDPKIEIVPHSAIFEDQSFLPVFSSPAIESQLHRIPGVSHRFIYFNDDVMLGAPTFPDDFVRLDGAPRIYLAWEVPKCNEGCYDYWIGDGTCDAVCNVSACGFDFPDCDGVTELSSKAKRRSSYSARRNEKSPASRATSKASGKARESPRRCSPRCTRNLLGDGSCDAKCNVPSCLYDIGDCSNKLALPTAAGGVDPIDVPIGAAGAVVNLSQSLLPNAFDSETVISAYVEGDLHDVVLEAFVLLRPKLLVLLIDGTKSRRIATMDTALTGRDATSKTKYRNATADADLPIVANWTATIDVNVTKSQPHDTAGQRHDESTLRNKSITTTATFEFRLVDTTAHDAAERNRRIQNYRPQTTRLHSTSCAVNSSTSPVEMVLGSRWTVELEMSLDRGLDDYEVLELVSIATHSKISNSPANWHTSSPVSARLLAPLKR